MLRPIEKALLMRGRQVAELSVVGRDPELLDQSERREQLRLLEHHPREDFLVEEIEAPGTEPDEIDEENCGRDEQQGYNPKCPFEDASEHAGVLSPPPPRGQSKLGGSCSDSSSITTRGNLLPRMTRMARMPGSSFGSKS